MKAIKKEVSPVTMTMPFKSEFCESPSLHLRLKGAIALVAKQMKVDELDLQAWLSAFENANTLAKLGALRLMVKHQLDPLCDEISLTQLEIGSWQPFITIDGWSKLINQHPAFSGMCFREAEQLVDGIPMWMECTIYRTDRTHPTIVREYFSEVVTEHVIWKTMPRRMLRHRTMQQGARLAFGIGGGVVLDTPQISRLGRTSKHQNQDATKELGDIEKIRPNIMQGVRVNRVELLKDLLGSSATRSSYYKS